MKTPALLLACAGLCAISPARSAEETATYRVIGFSHPEREADFRQMVTAMPDLTLVDLNFAKAEATLRFDPAKIVPNSKAGQPVPPEKVLAQLDNLLGLASSRTFTLSPRATTSPALTKVEITVGLLDCKGCRYGVYAAVAKIEGVDRAGVSDSSVLTAWIDPSKTSREALIEALKKARVELPGN